MFRLKNDVEFAMSDDGVCEIAYCENKANQDYNNDKNIVRVCAHHYEKLCQMRYGE